jgi:hypothetical protein
MLDRCGCQWRPAVLYSTMSSVNRRQATHIITNQMSEMFVGVEKNICFGEVHGVYGKCIEIWKFHILILGRICRNDQTSKVRLVCYVTHIKGLHRKIDLKI